MKPSAIKKPFLLFVLSLIAASCSEERSCFDRQLYNKHRYDICTQDCPGVLGCNGRTYCNECMANREGIRVVDDDD